VIAVAVLIEELTAQLEVGLSTLSPPRNVLSSTCPVRRLRTRILLSDEARVPMATRRDVEDHERIAVHEDASVLL
jgi:hypothetical protein